MFRTLPVRRLTTCFLALFSLVTLGCGEKGPELATVYGKVTQDGNPLPNVIVFFNPTNGGRPSTATTETDGSFVLYHTSGRKGVEFGEHEVFIDAKDDSEGGLSGAPKTYPIPRDKSKVSVAEGSHEVNFDLVSPTSKKK